MDDNNKDETKAYYKLAPSGQTFYDLAQTDEANRVLRVGEIKLLEKTSAVIDWETAKGLIEAKDSEVTAYLKKQNAAAAPAAPDESQAELEKLRKQLADKDAEVASHKSTADAALTAQKDAEEKAKAAEKEAGKSQAAADKAAAAQKDAEEKLKAANKS